MDILKILQYGSDVLSQVMPRSYSNCIVNLENFSTTIEIARKILNLFDWLRDYSSLVKVHNDSSLDPKEKQMTIIQNVLSIIYGICDNFYILSRLKILNFNPDLFSKINAWVGILIYLGCMYYQDAQIKAIDTQLAGLYKPTDLSENQETQTKIKQLLIRRFMARLIMSKETADNIGLLPFLKIVKPNKFIDLMSSTGSLFCGLASFYLKY